MRVDVPTLQTLGPLTTPDPSLPAGRGVAFHSASVREGDVFFALPGAHGHGIGFADDALARGAAFIVSDRPHPRGVVVADAAATLLALGRLARASLTAPVVGVTGSAGKTSIKTMLKAALGGRATPGNFNTPLALAATLVAAATDAIAERRPVVLELGIDHAGEMDELLDLTRPDHAVLTTIAPSHLDGLGDLSTVAVEKARLLSAVPGVRLVGWEAARLLPATLRGRVLRYRVVDGADPALATAGAEQASDGIVGERYEPGPDGQILRYAGLRVRLPWPGSAMAANALAALAMAERLGFELPAAAERLLTATLEPGRLQRLRLGPLLVLDDTYNSNPASAKLALEVLRSGPAPHAAVLGDMLELGSASARLHRELGAATRGLELVIAIGPASTALLDGNPEALHALDLDAAGRLLDRLPATGTVLFKASRGVGLERLLAQLTTQRAAAAART